MSKQTINEKIKEYLDFNKVSISWLAKKTKQTRQNLNRIINSENISVKNLTAIANALEVDITYFFEDNSKSKKELAQELVKIRNEAYQAIKFGNKLAASFAINDLDTFIHKNF